MRLKERIVRAEQTGEKKVTAEERETEGRDRVNREERNSSGGVGEGWGV